MRNLNPKLNLTCRSAPRPSQRKDLDADGNPVMKPPKRARTAYLVYCDRHRPAIMASIHPPGTKFTREEMQQVTTKLAEMWKSIKPDELAYCKSEALKMKMEYDAAKAACPPGLLKKAKGRKKNAQILIQGSGEKPKRARTAYLIFCDRHRPQIMKEVHPDPSTKFTREEMQMVTTRLAAMWKMVSQEELGQCRMEAELCKDDYKKQKEAYVPPVYANTSKGKKGRKAQLDGGKPKRPRTAYLLFAEDCRARLKKSSPGMSFTETSQVVSREWKELSDAKKNTYIRTAEKEQEKHRVLKANWEAKNLLTMPPTYADAPGQKPVPA